MSLMKLNGKSKASNNGKYQVKCGVNDPRGRHCVVYDTNTGLTVSHAWHECDAIELAVLFNSGKAEVDIYTAPINADVDKYLTH